MKSKKEMIDYCRQHEGKPVCVRVTWFERVGGRTNDYPRYTIAARVVMVQDYDLPAIDTKVLKVAGRKGTVLHLAEEKTGLPIRLNFRGILEVD